MLEYYNELLYYAKRFIGNSEDAKDVVQETYEKAYKNKNATVKNNRAYLYKITKNIAIDKFRKDKSIIFTDFNESAHLIATHKNSEEDAIQDCQNKQLMKIIQNLPQKSKQAFILHTFEGLSRKEISHKMDISISAVDKHIMRSLKKIKSNLQDDMNEL